MDFLEKRPHIAKLPKTNFLKEKILQVPLTAKIRGKKLFLKYVIDGSQTSYREHKFRDIPLVYVRKSVI